MSAVSVGYEGQNTTPGLRGQETSNTFATEYGHDPRIHFFDSLEFMGLGDTSCTEQDSDGGLTSTSTIAGAGGSDIDVYEKPKVFLGPEVSESIRKSRREEISGQVFPLL